MQRCRSQLIIGGHHPVVEGFEGMRLQGDFCFFEALKRYILHFESSFTKEHKDYKQIIININFTADFLVQLDRQHYKN